MYSVSVSLCQVRISVLCFRFYVDSLCPVLMCLVLLPLSRESDVIGSDEPVKANVGEDVILPCHLEPPFNVSTLTVEWKRNKTYVHVYRSMKHDPNQQNSHFINRTYLFCDEIGKGNISLLLRNVSKEDEGVYICYIWHTWYEDLFTVISKNSSKVVLQCESAGWYPEPELLWLDGEGNLLSAGPTETLRGPDDLYTVSSRVTVEKRHSNNITCRVQQRNTNQSRETHIHVPGRFHDEMLHMLYVKLLWFLIILFIYCACIL
uniref:Ig-like domain-containing protein n=1 Tax=Neolamprologus brichardi TaxID=32507 RepID=A0A3Q4G3Q0_NEOBR